MDARLVDDRFFPLVVNTIPPALQIEDARAICAKSAELLARREPYVTLSDLTAAREVPGAVVRKYLADWSKEHEASMQQYSLGSAIVIRSALVRGGLTALFWLAPPPYPQQVVATLRDGLDAATHYYAASGREVPESFARYRVELQATGHG